LYEAYDNLDHIYDLLHTIFDPEGIKPFDAGYSLGWALSELVDLLIDVKLNPQLEKDICFLTINDFARNLIKKDEANHQEIFGDSVKIFESCKALIIKS